jgi:tRNA pseudouridine38-40 synthase
MPRYRITLEYDGGSLVGWQRQDNGASVQGIVEDAIEKITGERPTVTGAGRTDAGVHALGQVAHFDLVKDFTGDKIRDALNHFCRPYVAVLEAAQSAPDFHARFSAKARHYLYRILTRRPPPALERGHVWHVVHDLDADVMHHAAQALTGQHDFTTFRAAECQAKSPVKTLDKLAISRAADEIHIEASARSFLHHQVRSMVGSLKLVGEGKWRANDLKDALDAADRTRCGPVSPSEGLYLVRVDY